MKQIKDLHVAPREEDIGFYAGFLGTYTFAVTHTVTLNSTQPKCQWLTEIHACFFTLLVLFFSGPCETSFPSFFPRLFFRCGIYDRQRCRIGLLGCGSGSCWPKACPRVLCLFGVSAPSIAVYLSSFLSITNSYHKKKLSIISQS